MMGHERRECEFSFEVESISEYPRQVVLLIVKSTTTTANRPTYPQGIFCNFLASLALAGSNKPFIVVAAHGHRYRGETALPVPMKDGARGRFT